jgi:hypothetical protein
MIYTKNDIEYSIEFIGSDLIIKALNLSTLISYQSSYSIQNLTPSGIFECPDIIYKIIIDCFNEEQDTTIKMNIIIETDTITLQLIYRSKYKEEIYPLILYKENISDNNIEIQNKLQRLNNKIIELTDYIKYHEESNLVKYYWEPGAGNFYFPFCYAVVTEIICKQDRLCLKHKQKVLCDIDTPFSGSIFMFGKGGNAPNTRELFKFINLEKLIVTMCVSACRKESIDKYISFLRKLRYIDIKITFPNEPPFIINRNNV